LTPGSGIRPAAGLLLGLLLALTRAGPSEEQAAPYGPALEGEQAESFLRAAAVVAREAIGEGVTRPQRLTLSDGTRSVRAVWKTIDVHQPGMARMESGGWEFDFRDSWRSEVAAYELDKLLGLGLVPPTVERELEGRRGSLQIWIEGAMTEKSRRRRGMEPSGPREVIRWGHQIYNTRLLHQLTHNTDFRNIENVLVDPSFRVYVVDSSRAFRIQQELLAPSDLECFSRFVLQRMEGLDRTRLDEKLGRWLSGMQVDGLLQRRDRILEIVRRRLEEKGPGRVLFGPPPTEDTTPPAGFPPSDQAPRRSLFHHGEGQRARLSAPIVLDDELKFVGPGLKLGEGKTEHVLDAAAGVGLGQSGRRLRHPGAVAQDRDPGLRGGGAAARPINGEEEGQLLS
jgi:hypothetical protein